MAVIEEKKEKKVEAAETTPKKVVKKAAKTEKVAIQVAPHAEIALNVLVEPWITEKSHSAIAQGKYTFKTVNNATKKQVKLAVEGLYGVKIEKITSVTVLPKKKAYGRYEGKKSGFKKITVTLKQGDKIELFQGA